MNLQLALVVDDDPDLRRDAAQQLTVLGYEAIAQAPHDPGLDRAIQRQPGLVLQGLVLQGFTAGQTNNPLALHEKLAAQRSTAKLLLAGAGDPRLVRSIADHARAHRLSVAGHLRRPLCGAQLSEVCRRLMLARPVTATPAAVSAALTMPTRRDLIDAIQSDLIRPWFQPIFHAATHRVARWEVLARWPREDGSYCPPSQFIRMAERTGLIDRLFQRVLTRALADARRWQDLGQPSQLALNLSMSNLRNPQLVDDLLAAVSNTGIPPHHVTLEITENAVAGSRELMLANISRLRLAGFPISIDDFGTGISGLRQLSTIPFTELKLDQHFVRNIPQDAIKQHICRNIITMAHDMGMQVVAEGIESVEEAQMMIDMDADELQGYLYAYPMPAGDVMRFLG